MRCHWSRRRRDQCDRADRHRNRPPTSFRLIEQSATRFVFENPEHDYPQRIIYAQQNDGSLLMRIEGVENGQEESSEWLLRRANLRSGLTDHELRQLQMRADWYRWHSFNDYYFYPWWHHHRYRRY